MPARNVKAPQKQNSISSKESFSESLETIGPHVSPVLQSVIVGSMGELGRMQFLFDPNAKESFIRNAAKAMVRVAKIIEEEVEALTAESQEAKPVSNTMEPVENKDQVHG